MADSRGGGGGMGGGGWGYSHIKRTVMLVVPLVVKRKQFCYLIGYSVGEFWKSKNHFRHQTDKTRIKTINHVIDTVQTP